MGRKNVVLIYPIDQDITIGFDSEEGKAVLWSSDDSLLKIMTDRDTFGKLLPATVGQLSRLSSLRR